MENIKNILKQNRPNITDSSINTYASILSNLYKKINNTNKINDDIEEFFCNNPSKVIEFLNDVESKKRKTILASLVVFCRNETAQNKYRKLMLEDNVKVKEDNLQQKMPERMKENWVSQDEMKSIYNQLEKETKPLFSKSKLKMNEIQHIQNFIILSLYTLQEPRRLLDYTEMRLRNVDKEKDNYIDKGKFIFNKHKTAKHFGTQEVPISNKLKLLLGKWSKINDTDYLLVDVNGNKLTQAQLQQRLNKIFGRQASVNIIRHSYLSDKYKDVPDLKDMVKTANNMGQVSIQQALEYVKKK